MPARVMMTTESFPANVFQEWQLVHDTPYIVGEFVWTAMDYLGESGIGGWRFGTPERAKQAEGMIHMAGPWFANIGADGKNPFPAAEKSTDPSTDPMQSLASTGRPYHASDCGDIDLTGQRKPQSYYRDILWNRGDRVYATVRLPEPDGQKVVPSFWSVYPTVQSWTWPGREGKEMQVEVYAGTERVRLLLNDTLIGEQPTGRTEQQKALFRVPYTPGTLKAIGLRGDRVVTESVLQTAQAPVRLRLTPDRQSVAADGQDLAFVTVEAIDAEGRLQPNAQDEVRFALTGPGAIAAVANGDATSDEPYVGTSRHLFEGRALVVVRAAEAAGRLTLEATAPGLRGAQVTITTRAVSVPASLR